jgi:hypothetical protein
MDDWHCPPSNDIPALKPHPVVVPRSDNLHTLSAGPGIFPGLPWIYYNAYKHLPFSLWHPYHFIFTRLADIDYYQLLCSKNFKDKTGAIPNNTMEIV